MFEGTPSQARVAANTTEQLVRSLRITCWNDIAGRLKLRIPAHLRWMIVHIDLSIDSSVPHSYRAHDTSAHLTKPASGTDTWSVAMVDAIRLFVDLGPGVTEVPPSLIAAWQRPSAIVFNRAAQNLRQQTHPKLQSMTIKGCAISIVSAGYWTTGLIFDFAHYLSIFDCYPIVDSQTSQAQMTLLVGDDFVIWCQDHSLCQDHADRCAIIEMSGFLTNIVT